MVIEQVCIHRVLELQLDQLVRGVAVAGASPRIDALANGPAGVGLQHVALEAAVPQRGLGRIHVLGVVDGDQITGEQSEQVGHVTVLVVRLVAADGGSILLLAERTFEVPFLDLAGVADLDRLEQALGAAPGTVGVRIGEVAVVALGPVVGRAVGGIADQTVRISLGLGRLDGVVEHLPHERALVRVAVGAQRALFGRVRDAGSQAVTGAGASLVQHVVDVEVRFLLEQRVHAIKQGRVAGVLVRLVHVLQDPRHGGRAPTPRERLTGCSPAVSGVLGVGHVALALADRRGLGVRRLRARVDLGGHTAGLDQTLHILDERLGELSHVGRIGRPVVHLEVHVHVEVGAPRRVAVGVVARGDRPDALQVAGQLTVLTGGADGQVAAVLVHQRLQLALLRGGCGAPLVRLEQRVGGDGAVGAVAGLAQIDLHAVVDGGMIVDVRFLDGGVALVGGVLHDLGDAGVHLGGGFAGAVGRILLLVVRRGGDVQRDRLRVGDLQRSAVGAFGERALTVVEDDLDLRVVQQAVVAESALDGERVTLDRRGFAGLGVVRVGRHADVEVQLAGFAGREAGDHDIVGVRREVFACVGDAVMLERDVGLALAQVQVAAVFGDGRVVEPVVEVDVAPVQVVALLGRVLAAGQVAGIDRLGAVRELLVERAQRGAVLTLGLVVAAVVAGRGSGAAGPQRLLVEGDAFTADLAPDGAADLAVAERQGGLLPTVVVGVAVIAAGGGGGVSLRRGLLVPQPVVFAGVTVSTVLDTGDDIGVERSGDFGVLVVLHGNRVYADAGTIESAGVDGVVILTVAFGQRLDRAVGRAGGLDHESGLVERLALLVLDLGRAFDAQRVCLRLLGDGQGRLHGLGGAGQRCDFLAAETHVGLVELAQGQRDLLLGGVGAELGELCLDDVGHVEQNLLGVARFDGHAIGILLRSISERMGRRGLRGIGHLEVRAVRPRGIVGVAGSGAGAPRRVNSDHLDLIGGRGGLVCTGVAQIRQGEDGVLGRRGVIGQVERHQTHLGVCDIVDVGGLELLTEVAVIAFRLQRADIGRSVLLLVLLAGPCLQRGVGGGLEIVLGGHGNGQLRSHVCGRAVQGRRAFGTGETNLGLLGLAHGQGDDLLAFGELLAHDFGHIYGDLLGIGGNHGDGVARVNRRTVLERLGLGDE